MRMMQFRSRFFISTWRLRDKKTTRDISFCYIKFFLLPIPICVYSLRKYFPFFGPAYHSSILKLISFWSSLVYVTRNSIHQSLYSPGAFMTKRSCIHLSVPQCAFHEVLGNRIIKEFIFTHLLATCQECFVSGFLYLASGTCTYVPA